MALSFRDYSVIGLRPAILLKKKLWNRRFPVNFVKFLKTPQMTASGPYVTTRNKVKVLLFVSSFTVTSIF